MKITTDVINILLQVNGTSSYVNSMRQVTGSTNGLNSSIGSLMSTLSKLVSAAAIVKFSKQCITAASDLQEVANVMNVTFGQNAEIVDKWAKTQASSFGLSETAAKRYIGTYGTMAKQFGYTIDQATEMGIELAKLTGDVASFYNIEDKLAAVKLKSIFTGETETLKELGVVMTEANLNAYALEKGLGKQLKQMTEHEKTALRYSFVLEKLKHTQGDFARTSDGWANSVRLLKLNFENLKIEIGNELMPVAGQMLSAVTSGLKAVSPMLISAAKTVKIYGEAWKQASATTKGFAKVALGAVAVMLTVPRVTAIVGAAVKLLTMEITTLGGAISAVAGIAGILLMAKAFSDLSQKVREMKENAQTANTISDIGDSAEISSEAVDDLSEAMDNLGDAAEGLDTFLASFDEVNKVGGNNSFMSSLVNAEDLENILGIADGLGDINSMVDELNGSLDSMELPDISVGTFLDPSWWLQKWENIKKTTSDFLHTFYTGEWKENWMIGAEEIENVLNPEAVRIFNKFGSTVYDITQPWISEFVESWRLAVNKISDMFDGLWEKYQNSELYKMMSKAGSNLYDLMHEDDDNGAETFTYTSKSGITSQVLKYNPDGTETELYKKYKAQYNEDGSETELSKRKKKSGSLLSRYAAGGLPNKGTLFVAGENGPEFVGNFGGNQTKVVNQSQPLSQQYALAQPVLSQLGDRYETKNYSSKTTINNNSDNRLYTNNNTDNRQYTNNTVAGGQAQDITLQIDGRKIATVVIDIINNMTRSSGRSPLVELGG